MSIEIITTIAIGAAVSALASTVQAFLYKRSRHEETLDDRINKLTSALKQSSHLVAEVEDEIKTRQKLVSELQNDAEQYEKLISLNQDQVDAVAQLLQGELRKEGSKSFWKGVLVNFIFFIMGAGVSWYISSTF